MRFASAIASSASRVTTMAPCAASDCWTMSRPASRASSRSGRRASASARLHVMKIDARVGVVLGLRDEVRGDPVGAAAAGDDDDLGRARRRSRSRSRPTRAPWRRRRSGCRARRSCRRAARSRCRRRARRSRARRRRGTVVVTPASSAAAITAGSGRGQTAMISRTPATRAGTAVISRDEGSGKRPPGT